jgi:secreted trypsin-like serine protease
MWLLLLLFQSLFLWTTILAQAQTRIIGGTRARVGRFPYHVALESRDRIACGGSLIAPNIVLTAAHCQVGMFGHALIGIQDLVHDHPSTDYERVKIVAQIVHPHYRDTNKFDQMLLLLEGESTRPTVRLNMDDSFPRTEPLKLESIGFGATEQNKNAHTYPDELHVSLLLTLLLPLRSFQ